MTSGFGDRRKGGAFMAWIQVRSIMALKEESLSITVKGMSVVTSPTEMGNMTYLSGKFGQHVQRVVLV